MIVGLALKCDCHPLTEGLGFQSCDWNNEIRLI